MLILSFFQRLLEIMARCYPIYTSPTVQDDKASIPLELDQLKERIREIDRQRAPGTHFNYPPY